MRCGLAVLRMIRVVFTLDRTSHFPLTCQFEEFCKPSLNRDFLPVRDAGNAERVSLLTGCRAKRANRARRRNSLKRTSGPDAELVPASGAAGIQRERLLISRGKVRNRAKCSARQVTVCLRSVTSLAGFSTGLVGDPALCWNSTDRRGKQPARTGAEQRRAAVMGTRAGHSRPPGGPWDPHDSIPSRRPKRRGAWSRGCDASAGTFQEGWQRCGRSGAARNDRPRRLTAARPAERPHGRRARRRRRGDEPFGQRYEQRRSRARAAPAAAGSGIAGRPAQLAHQHPSGLAPRAARGRGDDPGCPANPGLARQRRPARGHEARSPR